MAPAATGLHDATECVEVDHDPETDQLHVLGRQSFGQACSPGTRGHFEVLLSSNAIIRAKSV
jgi:hypothetical protein